MSMTPEERLAALEAKIAALEARVGGTESWLEAISGKLDRLLEAAAMGRGAGWALMRIGGALVVILSGLGYVANQFHLFNWR